VNDYHEHQVAVAYLAAMWPQFLGNNLAIAGALTEARREGYSAGYDEGFAACPCGEYYGESEPEVDVDVVLALDTISISRAPTRRGGPLGEDALETEDTKKALNELYSGAY